MNLISLKLKKGFTLVEILGAVAVMTTLATLSVVSVRDSLEAGQKSDMQRADPLGEIVLNLVNSFR